MVNFSGMNIAKGVMYCLNVLFLVALCAIIISDDYAKVFEENKFKAAPVVCFFTAKAKFQLLHLVAGFLIAVFIWAMADALTAIIYRNDFGILIGLTILLGISLAAVLIQAIG